MMKRLLIALLALLMLSSTTQARERFSNDEDIHGFFKLFGGQSQNYTDQSLFGFGMRIAFPAVGESAYMGLMADAVANGDGTGTSHLGLALDIRLVDELFLAANYGWAFGFNDVNATTADARGTFYDIGLEYQLSEYIGFGLTYRDTDFGTFSEQEILYSFNIAMTMETWIFFDILFDN